MRTTKPIGKREGTLKPGAEKVPSWQIGTRGREVLIVVPYGTTEITMCLDQEGARTMGEALIQAAAKTG